MIYLIVKIALYLLAAAGIGGGVGWMLRQYVAHKREEDARRDLHDTRARIPQLESLARSRDNQIAQLKSQVDEKIKQIAEQQRELDAARETARTAPLPADPARRTDLNPLLPESGDPGALAAAREKIVELETELAAALARKAPSSDGTVADDLPLRREIKDLQVRLRQRVVECQTLEQQLDQERRKVLELERERELQNKSLLVLHQQLEVAKERPARTTH